MLTVCKHQIFSQCKFFEFSFLWFGFYVFNRILEADY
jgi:hypothetical protein